MKLSALRWSATPWGKANGGQWRYALRNALAMCLALAVAYWLDLDQPYWAMTSAAVVSFPTVGGVISKSLGRIAGSFVGAIAALIIAGHTLNEPALFILFMAGWLALCTWASSHFLNNAAYAFMLAGYTAAIIAFPLVNSVESTELWDVAQSRVCEVVTGILCSGFMMMVLPSTSDGNTLINALTSMHSRLPEHARLLWKQETTEDIRVAHEDVINRILTINLLRIQAFWSHYRFRRQNSLFNYLLHQQLRMTSIISGLRRMLLNWPNPPQNLAATIEDILRDLSAERPDRYLIARKISQLYPTSVGDYQSYAFTQRLAYFCQLYLNSSRWLNYLQQPIISGAQSPRMTPLARFTDHAEALWNALRTFVAVTLIGAWCLSTQWQAGSGAITLAAIGCVLFSSMPSPQGALTLLMKILLWLSLFSFLVKFGFMIQVTDLWQFLLFLFPLLLTLQLVKLQQEKRAALWGQVIIFMGSFLSVTNPPVYDLGEFLNDNMAQILGVGMAWLAFSVLKPSSDYRKNQRYIKELRRSFSDQLSNKPHNSELQFESLVYHYVNHLSGNKDDATRRRLLRLGVVMLNSSHVVWQLREMQPRALSTWRIRQMCLDTLQGVMTEQGVQRQSLHEVLQRLQFICSVLSGHASPANQQLAGSIWRLYCSLSQLEETPSEITLTTKQLA